MANSPQLKVGLKVTTKTETYKWEAGVTFEITQLNKTNIWLISARFGQLRIPRIGFLKRFKIKQEK